MAKKPKSKKKTKELKLDRDGRPINDYRGKKFDKKLGRFVYT